MDTAQKISIMTLVDSGTTGACIDQDYVKSCRFKLIKLTQPILVYNVDSTLNNDGSIIKVISLILHYNNHSEKTTLVVTGLGSQKLLLRYSWL